ncbi:hypothetical protein FDG96_gp32 [Bacillus phage Mgbh1]|uniref:Uncharacterized protein n=1 Tax=Bacillus phage Mgbh1 TaxID=1796993 RepID=A0A142F1N4_9CAUD|nr:hypothetical protein FDG96_gp32 [Bacillus phage Mgbh1]AMQ66691.1 hypothetical protein [Bacillus phage Mgbh1]
MNIDANKIIEKLSLKLAQKETQIAVLEAQVESLMEAQSDEKETKEDE